MKKKTFYIIVILVLICAIGIIVTHFINEKESVTEEIMTDGDIVKISVDDIKGITAKEAEDLCYYVMGDADKETGFLFSFGVSGAIEIDKKQYYVVRGSWLVNNSHMSYIGDFFVSANGKEIYTGTALSDEYVIGDLIWRE